MPLGPMKLTHIITSLDMGGAEIMLYRLLEHIDRDRFENKVISLIPAGEVGDKIQALGIPVRSLGMRSRRPTVSALFRLWNLLRREPPALLQTWMYHADLLGGLAGLLTHIPVVWGIHNVSLDPMAIKRSTIRVVNLNSSFSSWLPRRIVSCSEAAYKIHVNIGYNPKKFVIIPNGINLSEFHPDPEARASLRRELGLFPDTFVIGLVARFDPLKDHLTFVEAARLCCLRHPQIHFLMCGKDISRENKALSGWIESAGIRENCHLLGSRDDIPHVMAGMDINTLSSIGEAFPNVLGEAMACGVPCVATDVGDSSLIIGDTGMVVPPKDPQALADAWERLLRLSAEERLTLGERARQRIQQLFNIVQITHRYEDLYEQIVGVNK